MPLLLVAGLAGAGSPAVRVRWQADLDGGLSGPVRADETVYIGSRQGTVQAFEAGTGRLVWSFATRAEISAAPVVADGSVYIGSQDRYFYSLDAAAGTLNWSRGAGAKITAEAVVAAGGVYFVAHDGVLYALDARSGTDRWVLDTLAERADTLVLSPNPPVVHDRGLFTTVERGVAEQSQGFLLAIDPDTGESRWRVPADGIGATRPTAAGDRVLFTIRPASGRGPGSSLWAVDAASGVVQWRFAVESGITAPAVVVGELAILATHGGVFGVDLDTGVESWRFEGPVSSMRLADERSVYPLTVRGVRTSDFFRAMVRQPRFSGVHALDAATGRLRWSVRSKKPDFWPLLLSDGLVHVLEMRTTLRALDAATGRKVWSYWLPAVANARLTGGNGLLFITIRPGPGREGGSRTGKLICLEAPVGPRKR